MDKLAITYRSAQLYAHNGHNLVKGPTFLEDHEFLGELYGAYESAYDDVIERIIGLGSESLDLPALNIVAAQYVGRIGSPSKPEEIFEAILGMEAAICARIKGAMDGASDGTQNLLQGLADDSEKRQYKLRQRLA